MALEVDQGGGGASLFLIPIPSFSLSLWESRLVVVRHLGLRSPSPLPPFALVLFKLTLSPSLALETEQTRNHTSSSLDLHACQPGLVLALPGGSAGGS